MAEFIVETIEAFGFAIKVRIKFMLWDLSFFFF